MTVGKTLSCVHFAEQEAADPRGSWDGDSLLNGRLGESGPFPPHVGTHTRDRFSAREMHVGQLNKL